MIFYESMYRGEWRIFVRGPKWILIMEEGARRPPPPPPPPPCTSMWERLSSPNPQKLNCFYVCSFLINNALLTLSLLHNKTSAQHLFIYSQSPHFYDVKVGILHDWLEKTVHRIHVFSSVPDYNYIPNGFSIKQLNHLSNILLLFLRMTSGRFQYSDHCAGAWVQVLLMCLLDSAIKKISRVG